MACENGHATRKPAKQVASDDVKQISLVETRKPLTLKCPSGQSCDQHADYHALHVEQNGVEAYLSFKSSLNKRYQPAALQEAFRYADLYLPNGEDGDISLHVEAIDSQLVFLPAGKGRLKLHVLAPSYKVVKQGNSKSTDCRTDDVVGLCQSETVFQQPINLVMEFLLPKP